ncbi:MAG: ParB/RepB/Spo0J family partition protein, partial [Acetobacterium sp.]
AKVLEIALIENVQRENLNPIEEALAYQGLVVNFNLTQGEIGIRIGKSRTAVANTLRLLKLPEAVQKDLAQRRISSGHARAILIMDEPEKMEAFAKEIIEKSLSVRETEKRIKKLQIEGIVAPLQQKKIDTTAYVMEIKDGLEKRFSTKVNFTNRGKSGKIELSYCSLEELDRILDLLGYEKKE